MGSLLAARPPTRRRPLAQDARPRLRPPALGPSPPLRRPRHTQPITQLHRLTPGPAGRLSAASSASASAHHAHPQPRAAGHRRPAQRESSRRRTRSSARLDAPPVPRPSSNRQRFGCSPQGRVPQHFSHPTSYLLRTSLCHHPKHHRRRPPARPSPALLQRERERDAVRAQLKQSQPSLRPATHPAHTRPLHCRRRLAWPAALCPALPCHESLAAAAAHVSATTARHLVADPPHLAAQRSRLLQPPAARDSSESLNAARLRPPPAREPASVQLHLSDQRQQPSRLSRLSVASTAPVPSPHRRALPILRLRGWMQASTCAPLDGRLGSSFRTTIVLRSIVIAPLGPLRAAARLGT